jgi:hypothetical protein
VFRRCVRPRRFSGVLEIHAILAGQFRDGDPELARFGSPPVLSRAHRVRPELVVEVT